MFNKASNTLLLTVRCSILKQHRSKKRWEQTALFSVIYHIGQRKKGFSPYCLLPNLRGMTTGPRRCLSFYSGFGELFSEIGLKHNRFTCFKFV
jgi:hypothetical protein